MRIRRGLLFGGLFLVTIGAITLLVRAGILDAERLAESWRLWPLILVGLGLAVLLARTRFAWLGAAAAGLLTGVVVGGTLASGGSWLGAFTSCGSSGDTQHVDQQGAFVGTAQVVVDLDCGSVSLGTDPGSGWHVAADHRGPPPVIEAGTDRLSIASPDGVRDQHWTIGVGSDALTSLSVTTNAATADIRLAGANLSSLDVETNAGDILVDAGAATVAAFDLDLNAGRARVILPVGVGGSIGLNASALDLCLPPDANLQLEVGDNITFATNLQASGLTRDGETWTRPGAAGAGTVTLEIDGNAASLTLDPASGCR